MCGIVGLFFKDTRLREDLGRYLSAMLIEMTDRGPDSAGLAFYGAPAENGAIKLTLFGPAAEPVWRRLGEDMAIALGDPVAIDAKGPYAVARTEAATEDALRWLAQTHPDIIVMSYGHKVEIYKDTGRPADVVARYGLDATHGSHGIGHTRMATESVVTTEHSHPFAAAADLCLVHNGSLSNYNRLRDWLRRRGQHFESDNDTEVAARYVAHRLDEGASLTQALEAGLVDLDGFYTFAVGTSDGFAVMRDAFACKPAVLAECEGWVAIGSEFRALAALPGIEQATIWEPAPATVYSWSLNGAA